MAGGDESFELYRYHPSMAGAIIFIILFIITTALHCFQLIRTRTWFMIPMAVGGFLEWIGYVGRALSSHQAPNYTLGPYIQQAVLLLVAPALLAASIYMELGRIILLVDGESRSIIKKRFLTKIFVTGDVLSFLTQSSGGGIMAGQSLSSYKLGQKVVIIGLVIQIVFFGFFIITSVVFHQRIKKNPTAASSSPSIPWLKHLYALYVGSAFILIRSIFRVIEYSGGNDGPLLRSEVYLYIFDAVLMFATMVVFNIIHPAEVKRLLVQRQAGLGATALEADDSTEVERIEQHNLEPLKANNGGWS
ncbi:RTA1 like protein [Xylona heveae TC161]|uniref:RTA1 like protein n=1 Tax=Xylona heveae (strain CBS 132557 / TC161) TaxID=1328760 RepID=A0A165JN00_XYLHT|nr:RTA1 like protein [Xylona heveae TC161]KZF26437.1 RTA1 like protein [Xylona heveae TC161]